MEKTRSATADPPSTPTKRRYSRSTFGLGSIRDTKRGRKRWLLTICRDYKRTKFYFATEQEARTMRNQLADQPDVSLDRNTRLDAFLTQWLSDRQGTIKPNTHKRYAYIVRNQLIPHLGRTPLAKLTRHQVQAMMTTLTDPKATKPVSERTANHCRTVLGTALEQAKKDRLIQFNVAQEADALQVEDREPYILTADDWTRFYASADADVLGDAYIVAAGTAIDEGALLGLQWADVEFENAVLNIRKQRNMGKSGQRVSLKTKFRVRMLPLLDRELAALRRQKARQAEARLKAGTKWQNPETDQPGSYVFTTSNGTTYGPRNFSRSWDAFKVKAGLPKEMHFHDWRANLGTDVAPGTDLKTASELLGHGDPRTTQKYYTRTNLDRKREALQGAARRRGATVTG